MFSICLGVAIIGVGTDLLSYLLEYTDVSSFWITTVNMFSFFGYDAELMAFSVYVWSIVSEKEKISHLFVYYICIVCLSDIIFA